MVSEQLLMNPSIQESGEFENPKAALSKVDKILLRNIMAKYNDSRKTLAHYLGISESTLSNKMNERKTYTFNLHEVRRIIDRYEIPAEQIPDVFFSQSYSG